MKEKMKKVKKHFNLIRNLVIVLIALGIATVVFIIAPNYIREPEVEGVQLIINNKNLTTAERLSNEVKIIDNIVYLSKQDVSRFFDKYLYYEEKYNQYITTTDTKVATIEIGKNVMVVNGIENVIAGTIIEIDGNVYLPFSEMKDVYNVEIQYIPETDIILVDSLDREQVQAEVKTNVYVKIKNKYFSRTVDSVLKNEKVVVISKMSNGWTKVRTKNGKIGYIQNDKLQNEVIIREDEVVNKVLNGAKVSLVFDYFNANVPNRIGSYIKGINVISPSFFSLKKLGKGDIVDKVMNNGNNGTRYIEWAKECGYNVWALVQNDSMIETVSEIINDYEIRKTTIERIVDLVFKYDLDGITLDFENIYKDDKDMFTRFVIELYPRLKDIGKVFTVCVTAPDGGENWSLCYDRDAISENCDFLIFMGYDQNNENSKKAGSVSGYNWINNNIEKFLGQENVSHEKIIVAFPFYTRLWTENANGEITKASIVNMKDVQSVIRNKGEITWNDVTRQNYIEYTEGKNVKKMWIEDEKSLREKLNIINEKELAGAAFWAKDRENDEIWDMIDQVLFNK